MSSYRPNWKYWVNLATVWLEQAVCLSLDFDPRILAEEDARYVREDEAESRERFHTDFIERRDVALTHIRERKLEARQDLDNGKYSLTLQDFRKWGESLPSAFDFPDGFPRALEVAQSSSVPAVPIATKPALDKPLYTRERNNMLRVIRALDVMAKLPDRGPASSVVEQLQKLGFNSPGDDTVRNLISEARKLEKD